MIAASTVLSLLFASRYLPCSAISWSWAKKPTAASERNATSMNKYNNKQIQQKQQMPQFPAVEKLAAKGLLAVETWNNKRAMINFKATIEVPMLGTMIESCGDTLDESHMPLGWPMSIDGAVRQFCMHKRDTIQQLNNMLAEFNLQRSSVEINQSTALWSHNSVWNRKYMDPLPGYTLQQLWDESEHYIT